MKKPTNGSKLNLSNAKVLPWNLGKMKIKNKAKFQIKVCCNLYFLTQFSTQVDDSIECLDGEVNRAVDVSEVGELYPQCLVHGGEVDDGIGRQVVPVQGPAGLVQPNVLLRPPDGVVGPIHGYIWKCRENITPFWWNMCWHTLISIIGRWYEEVCYKGLKEELSTCCTFVHLSPITFWKHRSDFDSTDTTYVVVRAFLQFTSSPIFQTNLDDFG